MNANWDKLYSAALSVDTKVFGQSVEIKAITPSQIEKIVSQADESQAIETAKNIAIANSIGQLLHDSRIGSSRSGIGPGLIGTEPVLAKYYPPNGYDNGEKTIQLRIILSR